MISRLLIVSILIFVWSGAGAAETYRWEDADGNVHYSDFPPPPDARNVGRTKAGSKAPSPSLPYELQVAVSKYPVTLYVAKDCGSPCDKARALLMERGVPHTLLDAMKPEVTRKLKALPGGKLEVPVAEVGELVLRGFETGRWNSMLDLAGYPRDAMIEVTPNVPADDAVAPNGESEDATDEADSDDAESDDTDVDDEDSDDEDSDDDETELEE